MAKQSFTDIFDAARKGTVEDVRYFVEQQGMDINAEDADGWTPLDIAKGKGNAEVVRYLNYAMGKEDSGFDTYFDAQRTRPFTKVEQAEIDCFCKAYGNDVHAVNENGEPFLLHEAAAYWDVAVVRYLILQGADVLAINEGFTPLMSAIADSADFEVSYYLYHEFIRARLRRSKNDHDYLIAFAKEMGNTEVAEYITDFVDKMMKHFTSLKDSQMKVLDTAVNAEADSTVGKWWRESGKEILLPTFENLLEYMELTPEEIDLLRRAREEL